MTRGKGSAAKPYGQRQAGAKKGPNNACERCKCVRSNHAPRGGACKLCGPEACPEMVFDLIPRRKPSLKNPPITPEKLAQAEELLKDGCSYADAARTVGGVQSQVLRQRLPGYGAAAIEAGRLASGRPWDRRTRL